MNFKNEHDNICNLAVNYKMLSDEKDPELKNYLTNSEKGLLKDKQIEAELPPQCLENLYDLDTSRFDEEF